MAGFTGVLAHQGGWDELLLVATPIALFVLLLRMATARSARLGASHPGDGPPPGPGPSTRPDPEPGAGGPDPTPDPDPHPSPRPDPDPRPER